MKTTLYLITFLFSLLSYGQQNCTYLFEYDNAINWTQVDLNSNSAQNPNNRILIDPTDGMLHFNATPDGGNDIRYFRNLGAVLGDSWRAEFEFEFTEASNSPQSIAHPIFALTANNSEPVREIGDGNPENFSDNDGIMVYIYNGNGSLADIRIRVLIKDGNVLVPGQFCPSAPIDEGTDFRIILERMEGEFGRLRLIDITDEQNPDEILNCCFEIPATVEGLRFLQHSNQPGGMLTRTLTGTIDNSCILDNFREDECCLDREILGPPFICEDDPLSTFSVTNVPGVDYNWNVLGATFSGQGTNSITINSLTGNESIIITLEMTCGCVVTTLTRTIIVNESLGNGWFDDDLDPVQGAFNNITASDPALYPPGVTHYWEIYEASDCDPNNTAFLNEATNPIPILPSPQTGASFSFTNLLDPTKCYVIQHIVSYDGGHCSVEFRRVIVSGESESIANNGSGQTASSINQIGSKDIRIYPNPTSASVKIELANGLGFKYVVYDESGRVMVEGDSKVSKIEVDLSTLADGIYTLNIEDETGKKYQHKISKMN